MEPVKIFYCCTSEPQDKELRDELETHLMALKRLKQITLRLTRNILAGTDWKYEQDERLQMADLILLLVSPDFIASDYHFGVEMHNVLEKYQAGNVWVIPILLRPTALWDRTPFGKLSVLPKDGTPITEHANRDAALVAIVKEISQIVALLLGQKLPPTSPADKGKISSDTQKMIVIVKPRCITCGTQNTTEASICVKCGDLLYDVASYNASKGASMVYKPEKIEVAQEAGSITASFILTDNHTVTYGGSGFIYIDGKGIKVEVPGETRFTIEEVDCLFYFTYKPKFLSGNYMPHLEVGGFNIF